ncbi:hypothetical protein Trydic_g3025 [Trypoxylus dichotomus]
MRIFCGVIILYLATLASAQSERCSVLEEIRDVEIRSTGNMLLVFWQEPINIITCGFSNVKHKVIYQGYSGSQEIETEDYFALFTYDPYTCVPGVITITVSADDAEPVEHREEYYEETVAIENLLIKQQEDRSVIASWEIPSDGTEKCEFVYHISYVDPNGATHEYETTDLEYNLGVSLSSCLQASFTVTPYLANVYKGISASVTYEGSISAVKNYALKTALGQVVANFDPPAGIENCEITYELREIDTEDCFVKEVRVAAYNGRIYSEWVSDFIEVEVSSVEGLVAAIGDNTIELSWTEPQSASSCLITYDVVVNDYQFVTSESSASIPDQVLMSCQYTNVTVSPISSSGKLGLPAYIEVKPELAAVQNIAVNIENGVVVATWDPPVGSEKCVLSYLLEYVNEHGNHLFLTEENRYSFEYSACIDVNLTVVAHSEDGSESIGSSTVIPAAADC